MAAQWHSNQSKPGDKNREPVVGEFFATEAISNAAEALIREVTQKTLEAALSDRAIRIYISGLPHHFVESAGSIPPFRYSSFS